MALFKQRKQSPAREPRGMAGGRILVLWLALSLLGGLLAGPQAQAKDKYVPFVESLAVAQKRTYVASAPSGQDLPLATAAEPLSVPVSTLQATDETSRLEELAEEKSGPLTLAETQQDQILPVQLSAGRSARAVLPVGDDVAAAARAHGTAFQTVFDAALHAALESTRS